MILEEPGIGRLKTRYIRTRVGLTNEFAVLRREAKIEYVLTKSQDDLLHEHEAFMIATILRVLPYQHKKKLKEQMLNLLLLMHEKNFDFKIFAPVI